MEIKCNYCTKDAELVDSFVVYGHLRNGFSKFWFCRDCDAYCGVHKGTDNPLGSLAKKELRILRKKAHFYFDSLWRAKMRKEKISANMARSAAYKWLSSMLNIESKDCHIAMFNESTCRRVIEICKPYYQVTKVYNNKEND